MSAALRNISSNRAARRGGYGRWLGGIAAAACVLAGWTGPVLAQSAATEDKASQYAHLMQEADSIELYNTERQRQLQSMQEEMASMQAQLNELDGAPEKIGALLQKMYTNLTRFVEEDLPFFPEERRQRMERLESVMSQDGSLSEKYRRLMEVYQVEFEYGRTMEAYDGKLDDGRDVHFIHLGRISLMYRTKDGSETGYWDATKKSWVKDLSYFGVITEALNIAKETSAPDIITVPVPAAKETPL